MVSSTKQVNSMAYSMEDIGKIFLTNCDLGSVESLKWIKYDIRENH